MILRQTNKYRSLRALLVVVGSFFSFLSLHSQQQLTNIPTFYLTTENAEPVVEKEKWVNGNITVVSSDETENLSMAMEIRGRGNSTWGMAKKPYRIKLSTKTNLLNLPAKEKNWVLLANYADKTLIRNAIAFKISSMLRLEFTPSVRFVDVYLNGVYQGNYMLSDHMERGDNRVAVEEMKTTDITLPNLSGGYLLEIDGFADSELVKFTTNKSLKITVKYPKDDEIVDAQFNYIKNFTNQFEDVLFSANFADSVAGYRPLVDTGSLIDWYIASELTGNPDCFWSTYIYKKRGIDKFFFGPMWDYDIAFNNDHRLGDAVEKLMRENAFNPRQWIQQFWKDEWFRSEVNRRWEELLASGILDELLTYVDETVALIDASQQKNFERWKILNTKVYNEQFLFPTYGGGVDYLRTYLNRRVDFLTRSFAESKPAEPSSPFAAEDFYYRIINKGTNNAIDVADNSLDSGAKLVMWSPISDDNSQFWKVEAVSDNSFRILNRHSGLAMAGNGRGNNLVQIAGNESDDSQLWKITPVHTGDIYGLENLKSGYSANNSGGNAANGTSVIEYDNNIYLEEKINQHWYIEKIEKIETGTSIPEIVTDAVANQPAALFRIDGQCVYSTTQPVFEQFDQRWKDLDLQPGVYILKIGNKARKIVISR